MYKDTLTNFSYYIKNYILKKGLYQEQSFDFFPKLVLENLKDFFDSFDVILAYSKTSVLLCGIVYDHGKKIYLNILFTIHENDYLEVTILDNSSISKPEECEIIDPEIYPEILTFKYEPRNKHNSCVQYLCDYFGKNILITKKYSKIFVHIPKKYIEMNYLKNCPLKHRVKNDYYIYRLHTLLKYINFEGEYEKDLEYLNYNDSVILYIQTGSTYDECNYVIKSQKPLENYNLCDYLKKYSYYSHKQDASGKYKYKYKCNF